MPVEALHFHFSSAVYGETENFRLAKRPAATESPYAASRFMGEYYCRNFSELYGLETVALRYFNVFGPRQIQSRAMLRHSNLS